MIVAAAVAAALPAGPLEIPALDLVGCVCPTSAIEARFVSLHAGSLQLTRVPPLAHSDRPLEIEIAAIGCDVGATASLIRWSSTQDHFVIAVEGPPSLLVPLSLRPLHGGWVARALIRPVSWADAASITVDSLSLAGRPLPCDCLPATLRVGYNHAPLTAGAVYAAAQAGDVLALQAALTEEVDSVGKLGGNRKCVCVWGGNGR